MAHITVCEVPRRHRHIGTHRFGIYRGSIIWLDRYDGAWWAGSANYDVIPDDQTEPYGGTYNTQVVKRNDVFRVVEAWTRRRSSTGSSR